MALINVAKAHTSCPVCYKNDWCMVSEDGKLALCQRTPNNHPNKKGGWWHSLEENIHYDKSLFKKKQLIEKAPIETLNKVYSSLLSKLPLTNEHIEKLTERGISKEEITYFNYRSLPKESRFKITNTLVSEFGEEIFKNIPGFYTANGKYGDFINITGGSGFTIPIQNTNKDIIGIQVRVDQPTEDTKYIWLSSTDEKNGTSSGAPVHIAIPPVIKRNEIWITEGPLKANVLAWRRKCIVMAAPGVSNWGEIPENVLNIRMKYGITGACVIAYDADYKEKIEVKSNALNLYKSLLNRGSSVYFAIWNIAEGKGIDDISVNKGKVTIVRMI